MSSWEEIDATWKRAQVLSWQSVQVALDIGADLLAKKTKDVSEKWQRAQLLGWQSVQAALDVGDALVAKKADREFQTRVSEIWISPTQSADLMRLAQNRNLIEQAQPESMPKALALLEASEKS